MDNENQDDGLIKRAFEKFDADDDGIIAIVDVVKLILSSGYKQQKGGKILETTSSEMVC